MRLSCVSLVVVNLIWVFFFFICVVVKVIFVLFKVWVVFRFLVDLYVLVVVCVFFWVVCIVVCVWVSVIFFWFCIFCVVFWLCWSVVNFVFNVLRWFWLGNILDNIDFFDCIFFFWVWCFLVNVVFFVNNLFNFWVLLVKFWVNFCFLIGLYRWYLFFFLINL